MEEVFTLKEVAEKLRTTPRVIRKLCNSGILGNETKNRRDRYNWLFGESDLKAFIDGPKYKSQKPKSETKKHDRSRHLATLANRY